MLKGITISLLSQSSVGAYIRIMLNNSCLSLECPDGEIWQQTAANLQFTLNRQWHVLLASTLVIFIDLIIRAINFHGFDHPRNFFNHGYFPDYGTYTKWSVKIITNVTYSNDTTESLKFVNAAQVVTISSIVHESNSDVMGSWCCLVPLLQ